MDDIYVLIAEDMRGCYNAVYEYCCELYIYGKENALKVLEKYQQLEHFSISLYEAVINDEGIISAGNKIMCWPYEEINNAAVQDI